jgi:membrane protease YdiL (CAAX protease family)
MTEEATVSSAPPPGWRRVLYGADGLRAGWCLLRFTAAYLLLTGGFTWLYLRFDAALVAWTPRNLIIMEALSLLPALACLAASARLERRPVAAYGVPPWAAFGALFWEGALWGTMLVSALVGAIALAGGYSASGLAQPGGAAASYALLWGVAFLLVGINEEVLFRGYMLATMARGMGFWPAALLQSAIFGGLHYFTKPMETWIDGLSTGLIGLFACWTVRRSGDIRLATGFHFAFNFFAIAVFGGSNTANDGHPVSGHLLASSFHGPLWLTGGPMGPEASLLVFPLLAAVAAACAWRFRTSP